MTTDPSQAVAAIAMLAALAVGVPAAIVLVTRARARQDEELVADLMRRRGDVARFEEPVPSGFHTPLLVWRGRRALGVLLRHAMIRGSNGYTLVVQLEGWHPYRPLSELSARLSAVAPWTTVNVAGRGLGVYVLRRYAREIPAVLAMVEEWIDGAGSAVAGPPSGACAQCGGELLGQGVRCARCGQTYDSACARCFEGCSSPGCAAGGRNLRGLVARINMRPGPDVR